MQMRDVNKKLCLAKLKNRTRISEEQNMLKKRRKKEHIKRDKTTEMKKIN